MTEQEKISARYEANKKYDEANSRRYSLKMIKHMDADIISELSKHASIQGYIKGAIRDDIARRTGWTYDRVRRISFAYSGSINDLVTSARRASYSDPKHVYTVCILIDGTPSVIMTKPDEETPKNGNAMCFPIIAYKFTRELP